jgi:hypothetical protein
MAEHRHNGDSRTAPTIVTSSRTATAKPTPISFSETTDMVAKGEEYEDHDDSGGVAMAPSDMYEYPGFIPMSLSMAKWSTPAPSNVMPGVFRGVEHGLRLLLVTQQSAALQPLDGQPAAIIVTASSIGAGRQPRTTRRLRTTTRLMLLVFCCEGRRRWSAGSWEVCLLHARPDADDDVSATRQDDLDRRGLGRVLEYAAHAAERSNAIRFRVRASDDPVRGRVPRGRGRLCCIP